MTRDNRRTLLASALALTAAVVSVWWAGPVSAVATTTVGLWQLDEPPGAVTALDSSEGGVHGTVGPDVETGVVVEGATGYRFPDIAPNDPPARPEHLVRMPSSPAHDPGTGDYTVTVRFRTTTSPSNIVQKGQRGTAGGYWKIEQDYGRPRCVFYPGNGRGLSAAAATRIDDGLWHTVTCQRTARSVAIFVDGVRYRTATGRHGTIANSMGLSLGGKDRCDQVRTGCDYFSGDVDYVHIQKG